MHHGIRLSPFLPVFAVFGLFWRVREEKSRRAAKGQEGGGVRRGHEPTSAVTWENLRIKNAAVL